MAKPTKHTFYRPHKRVQEDGRIVTVHGEITYPPSMAKQEFKRECDINNILKQYSKTGMVQHVNKRAAEGMYTDLPDAIDFQDSLNLVREAEASFMTLPARVRDQFGNDPAQFLAFCGDPANAEEMVKLGLRQAPPPEAAPVKVEITNPTPPEPKA